MLTDLLLRSTPERDSFLFIWPSSLCQDLFRDMCPKLKKKKVAKILCVGNPKYLKNKGEWKIKIIFARLIFLKINSVFQHTRNKKRYL